MGIRYKFNVLPTFRPGEEVLFFKRWLWAASGKSPPSYRVFFSLPPLWEAGLYVTDRRVLLIAHALRLLTQEVSQWYPGRAEERDDEIIRQVRVGENRFLGSYLEIVSHNPETHWYRSPELRLRLYLRNAEDVCRLIADQAGTDTTERAA